MQQFKVTLTLSEIQAIGTALMDAPTKIGMPLLQKLESQVQSQMTKEESTEPEKEVEHAA